MMNNIGPSGSIVVLASLGSLCVLDAIENGVADRPVGH